MTQRILIPLTSIAVINRQRKGMDQAKLQELADDIEKIGLLHPVVVRSPAPGEDTQGKPYVLMVGGRRTAAHILLGRSEIEATLKDDLDPIEARIAELSENIKRADISWQEANDARVEIAELYRQHNPGAVHSEVATAVGVSGAQLSKDLALHRATQADPSLRTAISKGSAIRTQVYKNEIDRRIASVKAVDLYDLRGKLFTADGRDFIRTIPSQSIDLVFSDLPYGIDYYETTARQGVETQGSTYDDSEDSAKDFIANIVPEALRVVKPSGWVVFFMCYEWHDWLQTLCRTSCITHGAYKHPDHALPRDIGKCFDALEDPEGRECVYLRPELPPWIWTRRNRGNNGHWPELHASNRYEMLVVVNGGAAKLAKKPVENVLDFPPFEGTRLHAMHKPHELCQEIISRTTVSGERVLDICFGSGAHLAAAASLGRDFVGCEKNPDQLGRALTLVAQHYTRPGIERGQLKLEVE